MDRSQSEELKITLLPQITEKRKEVIKIIFCCLLIVSSILFLITEVVFPFVFLDLESIILFTLCFVLVCQGVTGLLLVYLYKKDIINDNRDYSNAFKILFIEISVLLISLVIIYLELLSHVIVAGLLLLSHVQTPGDFHIKLTITIAIIINIVLVFIQSFYSIRSIKNKRII